MHISFLKKKKVEWNCGNGIAKIGGKKNLFMLVCGNAIVEIGGKKIVAFVAMPLPKIWEEKKIVVAKITCEEFKKKSATSTIFLQHFYNKL